ncbi:MAG TPA: FAD-binding protein [Oscillospiraceae bacterium]|nr:FAD-binding protein [Oscillospiraceae bacterium]
MYDIAIIGAGPAGSTLARLLAAKYRVLLVERRNLLVPVQAAAGTKACGGLLAPDAQKVLGMMSLALPQEVIVGPQIFVVRTIDLQQGRERYYQRFYINLDRTKFDHWLFSLVPATVEVRADALCKDIQQEDNHITLDLLQQGKHYQEKARLVIGADGAGSLVRRKFFPNDQKLVIYSAIQEWFSVKEASPYFSVFFDSELMDFYGWSIPKEDSLLVGAALRPRQQTVERFKQLKAKLVAYGYPLQTAQKKEGALIVRPRHAPRLVALPPGVALIGEAAGWISPSSAEGFSYAFRSALAAAKSLAPGLDGFVARYQRETAVLRRNIVLKNLKLPFMYHPWLRGAVMSSGLAAVDVMKNEELKS